jgi:preprotein translocase subunit SecE
MANPIQFVKEAWSELRKVVWPTKRDTIRITLAVIVLSLVVAAFLGGIDFGLTELFKYVANR